jgi:hypothetical protein
VYASFTSLKTVFSVDLNLADTILIKECLVSTQQNEPVAARVTVVIFLFSCNLLSEMIHSSEGTGMKKERKQRWCREK